MGVGDASSGEALKRVLGVLVDRLLARPERRGRTLRAAMLSALLVAGGGWRERVVFRQALCDRERIWLALSTRLLALPAPAAVLRLSVEGFGPPVSEQGGLFEQESQVGGLPPIPRAPHACARPSPRCALWQARMRRCAPCASIQTRACPSAGWCWPRYRIDGSCMARVLNKPRPARVRLDPARPEGMPAEVDGERVESLRESWLVEDRWWTAEPLRRRYWELVGERGRNVVVFHDLGSSGRWFRAVSTPPYVELHCHSAYSFLDGVSLPHELVQRAGELGHTALALTDHNSLSGSMELAQAAADSSVRAIHGAEIDVAVGAPPTRTLTPALWRAARTGRAGLAI